MTVIHLINHLGSLCSDCDCRTTFITLIAFLAGLGLLVMIWAWIDDNFKAHKELIEKLILIVGVPAVFIGTAVTGLSIYEFGNQQFVGAERSLKGSINQLNSVSIYEFSKGYLDADDNVKRADFVLNPTEVEQNGHLLVGGALITAKVESNGQVVFKQQANLVVNNNDAKRINGQQMVTTMLNEAGLPDKVGINNGANR